MKELNIVDFYYKDKCFIITSSDFEKIHGGDIEIFNHKTGNNELFKLSSRTDDSITLKNSNNSLTLIINKVQ